MNGLKTVVLYTIEYYSALKKKDILQYVTTWMNLEDITLSEILVYFHFRSKQYHDKTATGACNRRNKQCVGQIFPDCKGQGRGFTCKLKKAFPRHPHLHSSTKIDFKFVIMSLILQPMGGSAWVMALSEKAYVCLWWGQG